MKSSHQRCPVRKGVLRNFAKFTGKHLCETVSELLSVAINLKRYTPEIRIIVFYTTCGVSCAVILLPELTALIDQRAKHHWRWNEPEESNKNFLKTHCTWALTFWDYPVGNKYEPEESIMLQINSTTFCKIVRKTSRPLEN